MWLLKDVLVHVCHVATPLPQDFGNGEAEEVVIQGAADGTLGILKACLNSKTVKRVVYCLKYSFC
jgi:hypothetical protein